MGDWKSELLNLKKSMNGSDKIYLRLPPYFNFKDHDAYDFDKALQLFQ